MSDRIGNVLVFLWLTTFMTLLWIGWGPEAFFFFVTGFFVPLLFLGTRKGSKKCD